MAGERQLIDALNRIFGPPPSWVRCGIGDDTAIVRPAPGQDLLWTVDALVEGVHFDLQYTPWRSLGWKSLAVNLSDIAAMGGRPCGALLSLGWPPTRPLAEALELAQGMQEAAREYGAAVIGGDTVASPAGLMISLTVLGCIAPGRALRRDGARAGEEIFVTGSLGLAAAGLEVLRRGGGAPATAAAVAIEAFLHPRPQLAAGQLLAEQGLATAAIDLSDGVASDLQQICRQSGTGALLDARALPIPPAVEEIAAWSGRDPLDLALRGGEDYQLLFTAAAAQRTAVFTAFAHAGLPAPVRLGEMTAAPGVKLRLPDREVDITDTGFDHFPSASLD